MHELSIVQNLVHLAIEAAQEANATQVDSLTLQVGALSGVVKDALLFSYDIVTQDTLLAGSKLYIEELPVIVHCPTCDHHTTLPNIQRFFCEQCDQPTAHIVQGKELQLTSLEYQ